MRALASVVGVTSAAPTAGNSVNAGDPCNIEQNGFGGRERSTGPDFGAQKVQLKSVYQPRVLCVMERGRV